MLPAKSYYIYKFDKTSNAGRVLNLCCKIMLNILCPSFDDSDTDCVVQTIVPEMLRDCEMSKRGSIINSSIDSLNRAAVEQVG